jgi:hypothetical protein
VIGYRNLLIGRLIDTVGKSTVLSTSKAELRDDEDLNLYSSLFTLGVMKTRGMDERDGQHAGGNEKRVNSFRLEV